LLASPIRVRTAVKAFVKTLVEPVVSIKRRAWLNSEDVPMTKPTLSNPRLQFLLSGRIPPEKLEPRYASGMKPWVVGSQLPNSHGLNSKMVVFRAAIR